MEYFIAVAEELHFGRAAKRVNISQPPLSQQIRALEDNLGVKLLQRTSQRVALTDEGRFFLGEARCLVERFREMEKRVKSMARGEAGRLVVGFVGAIALDMFPEAVRIFCDDNPEVRIELLEMVSAEQIEALRFGRIHIGFMRNVNINYKGLRRFLVFREPYMVALPAKHPLAALDVVPMKKLAGEPMIMFPRKANPELYDGLISSCREAGFSPNIVQEVRTRVTFKSLVNAGMGFALMPRSARLDSPKGMVFRRLSGKIMDAEVSALWREEEETPILLKFIEHLKVFNKNYKCPCRRD